MTYPVPLRLYKYKILNKYSRALLSSPEMFFAKCSSFNDPFEGRPFITRESDLDILIEKRKLSVMRPPFNMDVAAAHAFASEAITAAFSDEMADTTWKNHQASLEYAIERVGMLSLSAINNNVLMWSHYAKDHTGFCIEFDCESQGSYFNDARQVIYQSKYPRIEIFEKLGPVGLPSTQAALLTKSTDWSYEQEYRIFAPAGPGMRPYPADRMVGVYFGCRMSEGHKKAVKSLIRRRNHPVKMFQGRLHPSQYLVEFDQIG